MLLDVIVETFEIKMCVVFYLYVSVGIRSCFLRLTKIENYAHVRSNNHVITRHVVDGNRGHTVVITTVVSNKAKNTVIWAGEREGIDFCERFRKPNRVVEPAEWKNGERFRTLSAPSTRTRGARAMVDKYQ